MECEKRVRVGNAHVDSEKKKTTHSRECPRFGATLPLGRRVFLPPPRKALLLAADNPPTGRRHPTCMPRLWRPALLLLAAGCVLAQPGQPPPTPTPPAKNESANNNTRGFTYIPSYIGGFEKFQPVVRRRRQDYIDCLYNGTLTSRGVGVAVALPDVGRLTFAYAAPSRERAARVGVNASDAVAVALSEAGFSLSGTTLFGGTPPSTATVDLSPIKFALPVPEGDNMDKAAFLVEVRAELHTPDPSMLEDGYSRALEAAVGVGHNGSFRAAGAFYELSREAIDSMFEEARERAVQDMITNLLRYSADLGVLLGPLQAFAPKRRGQVAPGPDDDALSELSSEGGGRPSRLFGLVEVAADVLVCSGGFTVRTSWPCVDEAGVDIRARRTAARESVARCKIIVNDFLCFPPSLHTHNTHVFPHPHHTQPSSQLSCLPPHSPASRCSPCATLASAASDGAFAPAPAPLYAKACNAANVSAVGMGRDARAPDEALVRRGQGGVGGVFGRLG